MDARPRLAELERWAAAQRRPGLPIAYGDGPEHRAELRLPFGDGAAVAFCGGTPEDQPDAYALADPLVHLPAEARVLLVHGDADNRVPIEQSRAYRRAAGNGCELLELPGVGHFDLIDPRTDACARDPTAGLDTRPLTSQLAILRRPQTVEALTAAGPSSTT